MTTFTLVQDIIEANGKSVKQNKMELKHNIPLGSLVEINFDESNMNGVRLFVVNHSRDCDGEPLYDLSYEKDAYQDYLESEEEFKTRSANEMEHAMKVYSRGKSAGLITRHYSEDCLTVIH